MLPSEFLAFVRAQMKEESEYEAFLSAMEETPVPAFRVNSLKPDALKAASRFADGPVPWENDGFYTLPGLRPGNTLYHAAGAFYIQDASAMAPVAALDPKPGDRVMDMCAAPGGKSGQIAARLQGSGTLLANEYVKKRADILVSNLERLGVKNACVTSAPPERFEPLGPYFDKILVDAPCSGEGMFRKDPDAARQWNASLPAMCAARQAHILDSAASVLHPGGRLVYSTCTFNRTENEDTVEAFLARHPDFEPEDFSLPGAGSSFGGCLRLWPHRVRGEGHFVCRLKRRGKENDSPLPDAKRDRRADEAARALAEECGIELPGGVYRISGDRIEVYSGFPDGLRGIYTLSSGLLLGRMGKGYFEPSHALAIALCPEQVRLSADLAEKEAAAFMEGEAIPRDGENGWTLVTYKGLSLGWGKVSGGMMKNHLPKGLRLRGGHALSEKGLLSEC